MQLRTFAISWLATWLYADAECGPKDPKKNELPSEAADHHSTHRGQWRLVAIEGQSHKGEIITSLDNDGIVIRGHWAIGEIELFPDGECTSAKIPTIVKDGAYLKPLDSSVDVAQTDSDGEPKTYDPPWYKELRAFDECHTSQWWSPCYQCYAGDAWIGVQFDNNHLDDEIRCVKIFQKDSDAYSATRVLLQRWLPDYWYEQNSTAPIGNGTGPNWSWKSQGDWKGLKEGAWYVLKNNSDVAVAGAPASASPGLLVAVLGALLWALWC